MIYKLNTNLKEIEIEQLKYGEVFELINMLKQIDLENWSKYKITGIRWSPSYFSGYPKQYGSTTGTTIYNPYNNPLTTTQTIQTIPNKPIMQDIQF